MFVNETNTFDRDQIKKAENIIAGKLGSSNIITKIIAWLTGTIIGPVISFFKKMVLTLQ